MTPDDLRDLVREEACGSAEEPLLADQADINGDLND